jgi:hypothetical protein
MPAWKPNFFGRNERENSQYHSTSRLSVLCRFEKWLEEWFGELKGNRNIYKYIVQDLESMDLIPPQRDPYGDVTDIGRQFVKFVKNRTI